MKLNRCFPASALAALLAAIRLAHGSDDLLVYSDRLNNVWADRGWVPHHATSNPVHSGSNAMVFAATGSYQAWWLKHNLIDRAISTRPSPSG